MGAVTVGAWTFPRVRDAETPLSLVAKREQWLVGAEGRGRCAARQGGGGAVGPRERERMGSHGQSVTDYLTLREAAACGR